MASCARSCALLPVRVRSAARRARCSRGAGDRDRAGGGEKQRQKDRRMHACTHPRMHIHTRCMGHRQHARARTRPHCTTITAHGAERHLDARHASPVAMTDAAVGRHRRPPPTPRGLSRPNLNASPPPSRGSADPPLGGTADPRPAERLHRPLSNSVEPWGAPPTLGRFRPPRPLAAPLRPRRARPCRTPLPPWAAPTKRKGRTDGQTQTPVVNLETPCCDAVLARNSTLCGEAAQRH